LYRYVENQLAAQQTRLATSEKETGDARARLEELTANVSASDEAAAAAQAKLAEIDSLRAELDEARKASAAAEETRTLREAEVGVELRAVGALYKLNSVVTHSLKGAW
jgi:chromosome segregation ATPase